jgi:hypothetical protein
VELANRIRAIGTGGIGLMHQLARQVGLEPQGLVGAVSERAASVTREAPRREAAYLADGVQEFRQRLHQDSLPDRSRRTAAGLSRA